jgi:hypothetical protein
VPEAAAVGGPGMSEHLDRRQMELGHERLPADGGDRHVPAPDPIARDYLLLALRLGKVLPGLVAAYFGPADLRAAVEAEAPHSASRLREDSSALAARLPREVEAEDRLSWLQAQLVALEAQALMLTGDPLPYLDYAECLLGIAPERTPEAVFESAEDDLARLLPSGEMRKEDVRDRLAAWNAQFVIAPDRLPECSAFRPASTSSSNTSPADRGARSTNTPALSGASSRSIRSRSPRPRL